MARKKIAQSIFDYIDSNNLVDFMDLSQVPDVPQVPLERYEPPRGMPANLNGILVPENAGRLEDIAKRGEEMGGREWYNLEPLRQAFVEELGPAGDDAFGRYIDYTAATSPRSTVAGNIRRSSHFYNLDRNGQQVGGLTNKDMPQGYGHIAHTTHDHKLREIEENGGLLPIKGPKVSSFAENLKGNQQPMTIDTHNFSAVRNDPGNKVSPSHTQYKYLEDYQAEIAEKLGMTPAQFQASVWMAGDTGVADARPFMAVFDDVLTNTAEKDGKSRSEALRDFINGKSPLYGLSAVMAGGALMSPEEAEAGVADAAVKGVIRNSGKAIAEMNKLANGQSGRNPLYAVEKVMHDNRFTNYNAMGQEARLIDGATGGDYHKQQVQAMGQELLDHGGLNEAAEKQVRQWMSDRAARDKGYRPDRPKVHKEQTEGPGQQRNGACACCCRRLWRCQCSGQRIPSLAGV